MRSGWALAQQEGQLEEGILGLRAVTDFEYELGIAHANSSQAPEVYTFFLPTKPEFSFVSSSVVRELAKHGGKLDHYVPKRKLCGRSSHHLRWCRLQPCPGFSMSRSPESSSVPS